MRLSRLIAPVAAALLATAATAATGVAAAEEGRMPLSYTERPLTLPKLTLAPELGFVVERIGVGAFSATAVGMEIGARFGILDDLEVSAVVLPLQFSPTFTYGNPNVGATFRFLKGDFELGAHADVTIDHTTGKGAGAVIRAGVPARLHIGKRAKLDFGAYVPIRVGKVTATGKAAVGLEVPVEFAFDIIEPLHVGATTGVGIDDFSAAGNTFFVPLGFIAGYAIGSHKGPLIDIDPFFQWPFFATPGVGAGGNKINAGIFETGLRATLYLYL